VKKIVPLAFVMIDAEPGGEDELLDALRRIENINEAYLIYKIFDVLAKVEADTMDKIKETIGLLRRVRRVKSIQTIYARE
jgi:DNA-binding Lrp family transcriptional regulator